MSFDEPINRFGTHSVKWDMMERLYGVPAKDGLAMWVADMDFRPPACVQAAVDKMAAHGIYGYFGDDAAFEHIRGHALVAQPRGDAAGRVRLAVEDGPEHRQLNPHGSHVLST